MAQPIAAAAEVAPRDGLAGALGYGVVVAESDALDPGGRWAGPGGYTLEGLACAVPAYTASADFCDDTRTWADAGAFLAAVEDQHPFVVGAAVECSTFGTAGDGMLAEYRARAARALELSRWAQIARELWTGQRATFQGWPNRRLASSDAVQLAGGSAVSLVDGVALLEQAFVDCSAGAVQLIHVPRRVLAHLDAAGVVHTTTGTGRVWTAGDSLVVADRGYPVSGPPTAPALNDGEAWLYSTGPLSVRLGDVTYPERDLGDAVAYATNDVSVRAEQLAAVSWLCCHLAVRVRFC